MTTLTSFQVTNDVTDNLASYHNRLLGSILRSEFGNSENLSATRTLEDADTPIQRLNCNGANRIVKMPTANTTENHLYLIVNSTSSGTYTLTVQNNGGTSNLAVLNPSEYILMVPDGNGAYLAFGQPFSHILSPSQITSNQNNYNPTGAGSADVLRLSTDASRDITGFAFPAGGKTILVHNVGSNNIVLKDESASSTAANRFALSADLTLAGDQSALLWYDPTSSRWRVVGGGGGGTWGSITGTLSSQTDLYNILSTGWVDAGETWTYASASTFTISGDVTSKYQAGTRLKFTQTTTKYAVVASSSYSAPNTTVTIAVNTDYTIANAAITSPYYSYIASPQGYPDFFNFSPTWTNVTVGNGTLVARYSMDGKKVKGQVSLTYAAAAPTTSITGQIKINLPIASSSTYNYLPLGGAGLVDAGTSLYMGEAIILSGAIEVRVINAAGTYATWVATSGTVPFTWGVNDQLTFEFEYYV